MKISAPQDQIFDAKESSKGWQWNMKQHLQLLKLQLFHFSPLVGLLKNAFSNIIKKNSEPICSLERENVRIVNDMLIMNLTNTQAVFPATELVSYRRKTAVHLISSIKVVIELRQCPPEMQETTLIKVGSQDLYCCSSFKDFPNSFPALNVPSGAVNEKMLPLHKSIVSKIEKIPQSKMKFSFNAMTPFQHPIVNSPVVNFQSLFGGSSNMNHSGVFRSPMSSEMNTPMNVSDDTKLNLQNISRKSGSFESALPTSNYVNKLEHKKKVKHFPAGYQGNIAALHQKRKQNRRLKLQFDDQNFMDCGNINDFLSSSSLSSTDSETEETNESDHEGDDELTDWPGHEAMINFASKNEFKRANKKVKMPQIKQQEDITQDDDTLMSADEVQCQSVEASTMIPLSLQTPEFISPIDVPKFSNLSSRNQASHPINIIGTLGSSFIPSSSTSGVADGGYGSSLTTSYNHKQPIESEMSGETSNPFMASPAFGIGEVREIRAGCRRIREERPGFSIITSFNEDLLRYEVLEFF